MEKTECTESQRKRQEENERDGKIENSFVRQLSHFNFPGLTEETCLAWLKIKRSNKEWAVQDKLTASQVGAIQTIPKLCVIHILQKSRTSGWSYTIHLIPVWYLKCSKHNFLHLLVHLELSSMTVMIENFCWFLKYCKFSPIKSKQFRSLGKKKNSFLPGLRTLTVCCVSFQILFSVYLHAHTYYIRITYNIYVVYTVFSHV